jgi:Flp pilus assembly protein TadG
MLAFFRRLMRDCSGNVAMMFAAALAPLVFLTGMAIDYTMASDRQAQLNGFADAAALAAVTPTMMAQSDTNAATTATNTFNAQAQALAANSGIAYQASNLTVNVKTGSGGTRTAVVTYTAGSPTFFASVLGVTQLNLGGSATATAGLPPNIDFYLLLDDSPSMAIAATTSGISTMVSKTKNYPSAYQSCAFGCHESNPSTGTGSDLYALARANNVTLRMDLVQQAASNLMTTASSTMTTNNSSYRMAIYTFDYTVNTIKTLTSKLTGSNSAQTAAANIALMQVYDQGERTSSVYNNDTDTDFDTAFNKINTVMPDPGSGTNTSGDTPQEVLFLVTDGAQDKNTTSCASIDSSLGTTITWSGGGSSGCRQQSVMNTGTDWCQTIKNRGIRIAVLYTVYNPLTTNSWYNTYWAPIQSNIATTLAACSSPGLFYQVQTGGDISAALTALFQAAVQSAYLSK